MTEEQFKKALMSNAQLDNEKQVYCYQIEALKDDIQELEEGHNRLLRESKEKARALDLLTRDHKKLLEEHEQLKEMLTQREQLIENKEVAEMLEGFEGTSLESRLEGLLAEREEMIRETKCLRLDLEDERQKYERLERVSLSSDSTTITTDGDKNKLHEYKFKLKKAEQDIIVLQGNVTRLEGSVARYKLSTEEAEKTEDELKTEKRKILRDLREAQSKVEELETNNDHLQKRIDKLKNTKMATILS